MARLEIKNTNILSPIDCLECVGPDKRSIILNVIIAGEANALQLEVEDAQLLQSWLFLNLKKVKECL